MAFTALTSTAASFSNMQTGSLFSRGFKAGTLETFGFQIQKAGVGADRGYISQGFLGRHAEGGLRANWKGNAVFGLGFTALAAYEGYKEGGLTGAAKNVAMSTLSSGILRGGWNAAAGRLSLGSFAAAGVVAGAAYGYYRFGEAGREYSKKLRNLEMGADITDSFGTMATTRQRSLAAIQNSHVNGRLALGGEASLMHTPFMR